ncbi:hypothetical protein B1A99_11070 [Cohnella sp. CIP 111063]|uniref:DUF4358 domain-containing protein n=1 Tax=unclassified Cohnella TaxID=2636738 RepID=UPI000B8BE8EE|nr:MULTISPECIES: DUF4358 domain-containing protein [unclassified Cohnella]OXS59170.1 hypothetical protein B1A99_11070 [Cohnella sp. CIP 111063]PRX72177.1 uncharacterized protein DUF4358 [Cohnella sp. SGD-V74]
MTKRITLLLMTVLIGLALAACSNNDKPALPEPSAPPKQMADEMLQQIEQPMLVELESEMVEQLYHLDPALLEDYTIRTPMMNVKTNEIAILKVKDAQDVAAVEAAVKQRADDVQKQFETYLQDQYENAKNYKLVVKGNYVLFVISESADDFVNAFDGFFAKK